MKKYLKSKPLRRIFAAVLVAAAAVFLYFENNALEVTNYICESERLPKEFDGMKVVQISDLHNKRFGKNTQKLIKAVENQNPDFIFVTGDIIDGRRKGFDKVFEFASQVSKIAPVYYITGNHEFRLYEAELEYLLDGLTACGFVVLRDECVQPEFNGERFNLIGIDDFAPEELRLKKLGFDEKEVVKRVKEYGKEKIETNVQEELFNILLFHRPNFFKTYCETGIDVVFSGHAHGGQLRIPFIGSPLEFLFGGYTQGVFEDGGTSMIVSRGLGNSLFPFRIFNRPEVVTVTFKSKDAAEG